MYTFRKTDDVVMETLQVADIENCLSTFEEIPRMQHL
jgi:hypothetical protein